MSRILMVVASRNFRDEEYLEPRRVFDEAGCQVTVASSVVGPVRGRFGAWVRAERQIAECRASEFDAVVFVGGEGASEYLDNRTAHRLCREALKANRVLAAICMAPSILANAGVLKDLAVTAHPPERRNIEARGAVWSCDPVVVSGRIVTADGPASASAFGQKVVSML